LTRFRVTNPKNFKRKKIRIGLAPRARQRCKKFPNMLSLWRNTQRTQNPSRKNFFFDLKSKTCRIPRGFDQLFSSIGWQVMTGQSLGHYSGFAVLKGLSLWRPAAFEFFRKKTPKRTWLCARISPLLYGLWAWSKRQKTWQVF